MFHWQKEMTRLEVTPEQVIDLHRALNSVQLGMPGFPSQQADAWLCLFAVGRRVRALVILHLLASDHLAFFLSEIEVGRQEASRLVEEGVAFAESMGFLLGELDWSTLPPDRRQEIWNSLPLQTSPRPTPPVTGGQRPPPATVVPSSRPAPLSKQPAPEPSPAPSRSEPPPATPELPPPVAAAAEPAAPPKRSPAPLPTTVHQELPLPRSLRQRSPPTAEELAALRQKLRENLGRFLASL